MLAVVSADPYDRDWEWMGRFLARVTAEDPRLNAGRWPLPFTVQSVTVTGDSRPCRVLVEYRNERGEFGCIWTFDDDDLGEAEFDAEILLMNLGEGVGTGEVTWTDSGRTWWSTEEDARR